MLSFSLYIILVLIKWLQWLHNIKKPSHQAIFQVTTSTWEVVAGGFRWLCI